MSYGLDPEAQAAYSAALEAIEAKKRQREWDLGLRVGEAFPFPDETAGEPVDGKEEG